jgi:glycosyltransferase involved in cell wall biosynthesis
MLASSPPLTVGAAALAVSGIRRVPWVLDVRDIWPAAAVAVGELRGRAVEAATRLEHRLYRSAAAITTPSASSRDHIEGITARGKVHLLPSGTTRAWLELGEAEVDREALGLRRDEFVWTYAGNIGLAQDVGTAVAAAAELGHGFRLLIVGDGPLRAETAALAERLAPKTTRFTGLLPTEEAGRYMRASDALLVPLADSPGLAYAVPSKLYDACAVGRPIVVAARGEARRLADAHGLALTVDPGNPRALAEAVRRLRDDAPLGDRLVAAARAFAPRNLRELQADRLEALLASVARRSKARRRGLS